MKLGHNYPIPFARKRAASSQNDTVWHLNMVRFLYCFSLKQKQNTMCFLHMLTCGTLLSILLDT